MKEVDYCGCCGREHGTGREWCETCALHVKRYGRPWDRTYEAQHGKPCPLQLRAP